MITGPIMILTGFGLVHYFFRNETLLLKLALSFLSGFGLLIIPLFLLVYNHIPLNSTLVVLDISLFLILSFLLFSLAQGRRASDKIKRQSIGKMQLHQKILFGGILFILLSSFVVNLYWPVSTWDSIALYDLRAKIYARGDLLTSLWPQVNNSPEAFSYYYSYPPTTSLAHALGYLIWDQNIMWLYSFFYASLIIVFFAFLRKKAELGLALLFTLLLAINQTLFIHSTFAYTNLPYTAVILAALLMLEQHLKGKDKSYLYFALFLTIMSIMIRSIDPFYLILLAYLLFHVLRRKTSFGSFLIFTVVVLATKIFVDSYFTRDIIFLTGKALPLQAVSTAAVMGAFFNLERIREAIIFVFGSLGVYKPYLLAFGLSIFLFFESFKKEIGLALFIIFSILVVIPGTLFLSSYYKDWNEIPDSVTRLMMFLYPTILYFIGGLEEVKQMPKLLFLPGKNFSKKK